MTEYVVGFMFSPSLLDVVLVRKNRPDWQAGKLNGVGGKVEPGEDYYTAMVREFREETGIETPKWRQFGTLLKPDVWAVGLFVAISEDFGTVKSVTDEGIEIWDVGYLLQLWRSDVLPNVRWLVQMAASFTTGETAKSFTITETY